MTRTLVSLACVAIFASIAVAVELPKDLKASYDGLLKAAKYGNFDVFQTYFSDDYEYVGPNGFKQTRDEFLQSAHDDFLANSTSSVSISFTKFTRSGALLIVDFDGEFIGKRSDGSRFKSREVGTDTWKKINGRWLTIRTVDKIWKTTPIAKGQK